MLPASGPAIWDTLRITLGWAWTWLVLAELVAADTAWATASQRAAVLPDRDDLLGFIVLGLLGLITDQAMKAAGSGCSAGPNDRARGRPELSVQGVAKAFDGRRRSRWWRSRLDLDLAENEFVSVVGTSGCGKSTLLSIVAGLRSRPTAWCSSTASRGRPGPRPRRRVPDLHPVPVADARQNIEFALRGSSKERAEVAREHLDLVGLERFADACPSQLSGGMKQRVAIARALSYQPESCSWTSRSARSTPRPAS